jgi:hypothetical protein
MSYLDKNEEQMKTQQIDNAEEEEEEGGECFFLGGVKQVK